MRPRPGVKWHRERCQPNATRVNPAAVDGAANRRGRGHGRSTATNGRARSRHAVAREPASANKGTGRGRCKRRHGHERSRPSGEGAAMNADADARRRLLSCRHAQTRTNEIERGCEHRHRWEQNVLTHTNEGTALLVALAKETAGVESASRAERAGAT